MTRALAALVVALLAVPVIAATTEESFSYDSAKGVYVMAWRFNPANGLQQSYNYQSGTWGSFNPGSADDYRVIADEVVPTGQYVVSMPEAFQGGYPINLVWRHDLTDDSITTDDVTIGQYSVQWNAEFNQYVAVTNLANPIVVQSAVSEAFAAETEPEGEFIPAIRNGLATTDDVTNSTSTIGDLVLNVISETDDIDDALSGLNTLVQDVPTVAEFNARSIASASYGTSSAQSTILSDIATTNSRLTSTRAAYIDKLNVAGTLAHTGNADTFKADVSALATSTAVAAVKADTGPTATTVALNLDAKVSEVEGGGGGGQTVPRLNFKPAPGFAIQVSRRSDGTYKCTRPIRLTAGAVNNVFVFIDMSPLFGPDDYVKTVGTPTISGGSITTPTADNGPRDTYAVVELDGTATAGENRTVTLDVEMVSGTEVEVVFDVKVFTP